MKILKHKMMKNLMSSKTSKKNQEQRRKRITKEGTKV